MADVDKVIQSCVDDIWDEYDRDGNGTLDRDETKRFICTTLSEFTGQPVEFDAFSQEDFDSAFDMFDRDNSGTIDKKEMVVFIRKVAGLSTGQLE